MGALTDVPADSYGGVEFTQFGYEHVASDAPLTNLAGGSIHWTRGGTEMYRVTGDAFGADDVVEVSQRLIPQEPMVCRFCKLRRWGLTRWFSLL